MGCRSDPYGGALARLPQYGLNADRGPRQLRIVPDEESNSLELLVIYQFIPDW